MRKDKEVEQKEFLATAIRCYNAVKAEGKPEVAEAMLTLSMKIYDLMVKVGNWQEEEPFLTEDGYCSNCNVEAETQEDDYYDETLGGENVRQVIYCPKCGSRLYPDRGESVPEGLKDAYYGERWADNP